MRAGVPAGGQFAPTHRHEATGVTLSDGPDPGGGIPATVVLAEATTWGRRYARRYGADPEEVAGATAVAFYEQRARRRAAAKPAIDDHAYLNTLARGIALQAIGADRNYVRQAWRRYRARCDEVMQELGRELTSSEEDEIAAAIVATQEPRRRAPVGFHRTRRVVSLEAPTSGHDHDGDVASIAESLAAVGDTEASVLGRGDTLGPVAERAEQLAQDGDHAAARRLAWDALAELSGAPSVQPGSVTERNAAACRRLVRGVGGAGMIAAAYERGLAEPRATEALFAPFGDLDDEGRDGIVATLSAHRHLADDLWDMALRAATTERATRRPSRGENGA